MLLWRLCLARSSEVYALPPKRRGRCEPGSLITPDKIPKVKWRPIWMPSAEQRIESTIKLYQAALLGDKEARTELGWPEEIWGKTITKPQFNQDMPQTAISKSSGTDSEEKNFGK